LKRYEGALSPDYSIYRDMPLVLQKMIVYKRRVLTFWRQSNGIELIPNVRWGDERSYPFCFDGIEHRSTVVVGTLGTIQNRAYFIRGLNALAEASSPCTTLVYEDVLEAVFSPLRSCGIEIINLPSEISKRRTPSPR
jgi:hypothetical protein